MAMRICGSIVMAGVLSVGVVAERGQGEVIRVHSCAPGWIEIGTGDNRWCLADPTWTTPGGGGLGGGGEDGPGGGGGGGGGGSDSEPVPTDGWDDVEWDEVVRKWRCGQCKVSGNKCVNQARLAETTCTARSKAQAEWRCDKPRERDGETTVTIWGCSIDDLLQGNCAAAEAPWNERQRWNYGCGYEDADTEFRSDGEGNSHPERYRCYGAGIRNCAKSWESSHPGGSTQRVDHGTFSAMFEGFGATASTTVTANFELTAQTGYLAACAAMGTALSNACTTKETSCYTEYSCTEADLP